MTKATNTRGTVLLRVALVLLCLAVFYWGLHYKMSLYHAGPALQQTPPAKLWTGDRTSTAVEHAMWADPAQLQPVERARLAAFVFLSILLPFLANGRVFQLNPDRYLARKRQYLCSHSAFFCFRPPPSL